MNDWRGRVYAIVKRRVFIVNKQIKKTQSINIMRRKHAFALCLAAMMGVASMNCAVQAQTKNMAPQKVETAVKVQQSAEWYKMQERLWKAEIDKNRKNVFGRETSVEFELDQVEVVSQ